MGTQEIEAAIEPGTLLLGKLQVVRVLGAGGMARVYEVRHELTHHRRALKVLRERFRDHKVVVEAFIREASAAGRIGNAHIVETFDAGFLPGGSPYLLMEYLDGQSLRGRLSASGRLELPEAADIAAQCCEALQAAHEAGIVHRDLKPENLFIAHSGGRPFVKVLDFGIAHFEGSAGDRTLLGTPSYMPPEQLAGGKVDARSDLYALGVTLYEMLAGQLPWAHQAALEVFARLVKRGLPRLSEVVPGVPPLVEALLIRTLSPEPAERPQSAVELRAALRQWVDAAAHFPLVTPAAQNITEALEATVVRAAEGEALPVPRPADRFVGRVEELTRLGRLLDSPARLVVLSGPGGVGKTRTAIELANALPAPSVAFVDCTEATDAAGVALLVARALKVNVASPGGALEDALAETLRARGRLLLVLDNLEQALPRAEPLLSQWLSGAPKLRLLVTSQVKLSLPAAHHHELGPLTDALELLLDRVRQAQPDYAPSEDELKQLEEIVRQVDGLPLAIELASSRLTVLSPKELLERIGERLQLLEREGVPEDRRSAMRLSLDWSWNLLDEPRQRLLAQLSVLRSGFTLEAAAAVTALSDREVVDGLQALSRRSLLRTARDQGGTTRFSMLNTVREYAERQLSRGEGAQVEELKLRHARHYARLAAMVSSPLVPPDAPTNLFVVRSARANLSLALSWSLHSPHPEAATLSARLLLALDTALRLEAADPAHLSLLESVARRQKPGSAESNDLKLALAVAYLRRSQWQQMAATAAEVLAAEPDPLRVALARYLHGVAISRLGDTDRASAELEAALEAARRLGSSWLAGRVLSRQGLLAADPARAEQLMEQALQSHRESGDRRMEGITLGNLGSALSHRGETMRARRLLDQAHAIDVEVGNRTSAATAATNLGILALDEGSLPEAERWLEQAVAQHRELLNPFQCGEALTRLAACALLRDEPARAVEHAKDAVAQYERAGAVEGVAAALGYQALAHCAAGEAQAAGACVSAAVKKADGHGEVNTATLLQLAMSANAAAAGDFGASRRLMRELLAPTGQRAPVASQSDEVRLGIRCVAAVVERLEQARFNTPVR